MSNNRRGIGRTFAKPKNRKYVIKRLAAYLKKFIVWFVVAFILVLLSNVFSLLGPDILGKTIGAMGEEKIDFVQIYKYAIMLIGFYVGSAIFSYLLSILMIKISKKIVYTLRKDAFEKLVYLKVNYFDTKQTGDIISIISYDIDTLNTSLSSDLIHICTSAITIIGSLLMMLRIAPVLVLVFLITIPISLLFTRFMLKRTHSLFKQRSKTLGELNGYVEEMITGSKTIKAYGMEENIFEEFQVYNDTAVNTGYRAEYYGSITGPGINFVNNLSMTLICIFGSILFISGNMTLETLSSFVLYSRKFSGPINEIANIFVDIQSAFAAAERVFMLIDEEMEKADSEDAIELEEVDGDIRFKHVKFGYNKNKTIIKNLSFKADAGKVIAIVGPTGAGKTTIINLLMRFYDIQDGDVTLDNLNIYDIKRTSLRKQYAMVLQDTWLFQGTVRENIAYGKKDATDEEIINAAKAAHIHNFIMRLPDQYDTILLEDGINISKGQKQLLTIARAMLLDSNLLILDEATSNVDTKTEVEIQSAMKELMKDKTCFIIAHRLSTIQNADLILVVNNGNIIEKGTHEELINNKGFYHELYYSQFL